MIAFMGFWSLHNLEGSSYNVCTTSLTVSLITCV